MDDDKDAEMDNLFDLWTGTKEDEFQKKLPPAIQPPKMKLPEHGESYNPPEEYLFDKDEENEFDNQEPEERLQNFKPHKYDCLRHVEFYDKIINERFER